MSASEMFVYLLWQTLCRQYAAMMPRDDTCKHEEIRDAKYYLRDAEMRPMTLSVL